MPRAHRVPTRREKFQPLERRNLTLSRAGSFRNEEAVATFAWSEARLIEGAVVCLCRWTGWTTPTIETTLGTLRDEFFFLREAPE
jgi:hypothetical protein